MAHFPNTLKISKEYIESIIKSHILKETGFESEIMMTKTGNSLNIKVLIKLEIYETINNITIELFTEDVEMIINYLNADKNYYINKLRVYNTLDDIRIEVQRKENEICLPLPRKYEESLSCLRVFVKPSQNDEPEIEDIEEDKEEILEWFTMPSGEIVKLSYTPNNLPNTSN